ncbi:hypothetical protein NSND_60172 [Nitrospira sp. ND1]|nr:hypothetical protein NSND_60172 [Nitrospira sp. ND1]
MRTPRRSWVCGVPGAEVTRQKCCIGEPLYWYVDREIDIVDTVSNDLTGTTAMTPPAGSFPGRVARLDARPSQDRSSSRR